MKQTDIIFLAVAAMLFGGCQSKETTDSKIGTQKDVHGCIGSAGYNWCAKTKQCERPWKLAKKEKLDNTAEAFKSFCQNK
ncbi:hypothetical protein [Nitratifractor sp.]